MKIVLFLSGFLSLILVGSAFGQGGNVAVAVKQDTLKQAITVDPPKGQLYGPGDEISGKVIGEPDYNFVAVVDENGRIEIPFADAPLIAQCKTEKALKEEISVYLAKYLVDPKWTLRTEKRIRPEVTVFGEVNTKSKIELTRRATLLEMMALAGGASENAGDVVQVYRPRRPSCSGEKDPNDWKPESGDLSEVPSRTYTLKAMSEGLDSDNPVIIPGDVIFVPQASPIYVVGEVVRPGPLLLKKQGGTTLFQAIALAQGPNPQAKTKDIKIYRKKPGSIEPEVISKNLDQIKTGKQPDMFLKPEDIIVLDKTKKSLALVIAEFAIGAAKQVVQSAANTGGVRVIY